MMGQLSDPEASRRARVRGLITKGVEAKKWGGAQRLWSPPSVSSCPQVHLLARHFPWRTLMRRLTLSATQGEMSLLLPPTHLKLRTEQVGFKNLLY